MESDLIMTKRTTYFTSVLFILGCVFIASCSAPSSSSTSTDFQSATYVMSLGTGDGVDDSNEDFGSKPFGMVFTSTGNVLITDIARQKLSRWTIDTAAETGSFVSFIGSVGFPYGVALDSAGKIYVGQNVADNVKLLNADGSDNSTLGSLGTGSDNFDGPTGIVIDSADKIYIVDNLNHRVSIWSGATPTLFINNNAASNPVSGNANTQFNNPKDLALSNTEAYLAVTDSSNHRVQIFKYNSTESQWIYNQTLGASGGSASDEAGKFNTPQGIAIDSNNNMFVAEQNNHRVQVFSFDTTSGLWEANANGIIGTGVAASQNVGFNGPVAVAVFESGDTKILAVSDANKQVAIYTYK
jgi:tripartite motif-containing protein 71